MSYVLPETHEAAERQWVVENVPKGGVFIDVGADTGTWAIPFASHFERVFAIEPSAKDVELLREKCLLKNITNITIIQKAASWTDGEIVLAAGRDEPEWFPSETGELPKEFTHYVRVKAMTIDSLKLSPRLIKIDTEGWGDRVLDGAKDTLISTDYVVIEIHNDIEANRSIGILGPLFDLVHTSDSGSILYYKRRLP